jgi:hypothetical protein
MSSTLVGGADRVDELLAVLASRRNRAVLQYFRVSPTDVASLTDVAEYVSSRSDTRDSPDQEQVAMILHHRNIPKLSAVGVVEYDPRTKTVRYRGDRMVEECLQTVAECDVVS